MKKLLVLSVAALSVLAACNNENADKAAQDEALANANREQLTEAIADRDSLLSLVNQISGSMSQIKELEGILVVPSDQTETSDQREEIIANIAAIQQTLEARRTQLEKLERKLAKSNLTNKELQNTITTLRAQLETQGQEIATLKQSLLAANERIEDLDAQITDLNNSINTANAERTRAQQESTALANQLNTCYYAIGTKKELKENNLVESGFLRKTKILPSDFDQSFFVKADKRTLRTIQLHSSKAEVITNQPTDSYEINDVNGQKVLTITNPDSFWSVSNYLVVKID